MLALLFAPLLSSRPLFAQSQIQRPGIHQIPTRGIEFKRTNIRSESVKVVLRNATGKGALIGGGIGLALGLGVYLAMANGLDHGRLSILEGSRIFLGPTVLGAVIGASVGARTDLDSSKPPPP